MVRNIIITAGGTSEKIDDVRVISNFSSGRLGIEIAKAFVEKYLNDVHIFYLCDKNTIVPDYPQVEPVRVMGVSGLLEAIQKLLTTKKIDAVIHAMAVSDFTVKEITTMSAIKSQSENCSNAIKEGKISSEIEDLVIVLKKTPKVIGEIKKINKDTILVGFKLLTNVEKDILINTAYELLKKNDCDIVLANDLSEITGEKHKGYLIDKDKKYNEFETKADIALAIMERVSKLLVEKGE